MDNKIKRRKIDEDSAGDKSDDKTISKNIGMSSPPSTDLLQSITSSDDCDFSASGKRQPYQLCGTRVSRRVDSTSSKDSMKAETSKKRPKKSIILSEHSYSTQFSGPEVLFFFDLLYKPQPPPINMTTFPVVKVLEHIFKFLYSNTDGDEDGDHEFTKDGRNVTDIYSSYLKNYEWLSRMNDNDNLNFKSCTTVDFWKQDSCIKKDVELGKKDLWSVQLTAISTLLLFLHNQFAENKCQNHDSWKIVFAHLHYVLRLNDTNKSLISLRYKGQAVYNYDYVVPRNLVSEDNSSRVAKYSAISIYPEAIYDTTYIQHENQERVGKIAIEVYGPKSGSLSSEDELKKHGKDEAKKKKKNMDLAFVAKPKRETDAILSHSYKSKALAYLKQSLPPDCRDSHTAKKITGQHALQLIGLADEQSRQLRKIDCKMLPHNQMNNKNPVYKAIGMFLKNEYIIFSKLEINYERLQSYCKPGSYENAKLEEGKISFSHWRLDVMEPNHRLALIVTLLEILKPGEDQ